MKEIEYRCETCGDDVPCTLIITVEDEEYKTDNYEKPIFCPLISGDKPYWMEQK